MQAAAAASVLNTNVICMLSFGDLLNRTVDDAYVRAPSTERLLNYRSDFNPARSSSTRSFGRFHAAKCPPLSSWL